MSFVPRKTLELLQFAAQYSALWRNQPSQIGLTTDQVNALNDIYDQASSARSQQQSLRDSAKAATVSFNASERLLRTRLADLIKTIRAFAANSDNPTAVYSAAQIPPPSSPSPRPAPGTPTDFRIEFTQDGVLTLRWKCDNRGTTGVVYTIERRSITGTGLGPWSSLGVTGERRFSDETIPPAPRIEYRITAQRGNVKGTPAIFGVSFSSGFGAGTVAIVPALNSDEEAREVFGRAVPNSPSRRKAA
jgi:hypothetical protein